MVIPVCYLAAIHPPWLLWIPWLPRSTRIALRTAAGHPLPSHIPSPLEEALQRGLKREAVAARIEGILDTSEIGNPSLFQNPHGGGSSIFSLKSVCETKVGKHITKEESLRQVQDELSISLWFCYPQDNSLSKWCVFCFMAAQVMLSTSDM